MVRMIRKIKNLIITRERNTHTEVIHIHSANVSELVRRAQDFLDRIKPVLSTNECTFQQNEKNKEFDRQYNLRHEEKIRLIRSLEAADCVKIDPNNNSRYADSEVYIFIKSYLLTVYGEEKPVRIYIKMYLAETKTYDYVIVISFHQEGMFS